MKAIEDGKKITDLTNKNNEITTKSVKKEMKVVPTKIKHAAVKRKLNDKIKVLNNKIKELSKKSVEDKTLIISLTDKNTQLKIRDNNYLRLTESNDLRANVNNELILFNNENDNLKKEITELNQKIILLKNKCDENNSLLYDSLGLKKTLLR